jgi:hypothetical protein
MYWRYLSLMYMLGEIHNKLLDLNKLIGTIMVSDHTKVL